MVRLFHREYECYLSAEGSFAEHPPVVEDGECHIHVHTDHTHTPPMQFTAASVTVTVGV